MSQTTDAVRGGTAAQRAKGSALSTRYPPYRDAMWYLYSAPLPTPGMKPSQIPDFSRLCSGWELLDHPLKSPETKAASALGAQTAKDVPSTPSTRRGWAPSLSCRREWVPSLKRERSSSGGGLGSVQGGPPL